MTSLTINIATRSRPALLRETIQRTLPNISLKSTTLMISVDQDDQATINSLDTLPKTKSLVVSIKPREDSRGAKYDRALTEAPADIYLPAVDYAPITTPGFDQAIINAARIWPDGIGVVYSPMVDELVPFLQCPTAKFVEKLGYIYSHEYPYWFIDHEIADIAWMVGRINFAQFEVDSSKRPQKTLRMRDLAFWASYYDLMALDRRAKARQIIKSADFEAPDWLKLQLCNWYQLVESRSCAHNGRNARVRGGAASMEASRGEDGPPDEGYLRIKARAEEKLNQLYTALRAAA